VQTFYSGMLRVEQFGKGGTPLILIPGLFCGSWEWNGQIPLLSREHTVYAVTLPGFDGMPFVRDDRLMEQATKDLHALVVSRHLVRPAIVGHSLGGTLAIYFAEHEPADAGAIVAVEGGYPAGPTQAARNRSVEQSVKPYLHVSQTEFGPALRTDMLQYVITNKPDLDTVERLAGRSDAKAVVAWMRAALSLDLTPGLKTVAVPFEEIIPFDPVIDPYQGFKTIAAKRAAYASWVAHAPHGSVVMIAHSRHFVMFDRPDAFNRALVTALSRRS
jgi:pimeloyl-ACP methyl ester carboxylesterase